MTDAQVKERQFFTYEAVFGNEDASRVFNVNRALEALAKSVSVNRSGALVVDYSVVIPVLVNVLSELHGFFAGLSKSRLAQMIGSCTDQLFSVQTVVTEIGREVAVVQEERALNEQAQLVEGGLVFTTLVTALRERYAALPLHLTQAIDADTFVPPSFSLSESASKEGAATESSLDFSELLLSNLTVCRICIKGDSGFGKTTLCRYIAREWARKRPLFSGNYEVILYLPLDAATTAVYADLDQVQLVDLVMREVVQPNEELRQLVSDGAEIVLLPLTRTQDRQHGGADELAFSEQPPYFVALGRPGCARGLCGQPFQRQGNTVHSTNAFHTLHARRRRFFERASAQRQAVGERARERREMRARR